MLSKLFMNRGGTRCMQLVARTIKILCAKNYEYQLKFLPY